ncbi:MAG: HD domain-containing protein [Verrucomicrobiota bacterium]
MNLQPYRSTLMAYIRAEARPVDKFSHQPRLYELTRVLGAGQHYDDDVVFAAVWLHDLGVFVGHRPEEPAALASWDCVAYALRRAPELLAQFGFPAGKIPAVVEAIRTHQPQENPLTLEGVIVRDADILEQLGAVTVLRTVCKIGRDTRFKTFGDALRVLQQNLATLPAQLRLPSARQLAAPRLELLRQFLAAAEVEGCTTLE